MKASNQAMVEMFSEELNRLPLDFPMMRWKDQAIDAADSIYFAWSRKNNCVRFIKEIIKVLENHKSSMVNNEMAVDWVSTGIFEKIQIYDEMKDPDGYRKIMRQLYKETA